MVLRQVVFEIIILIQWFLDQIEHITGVHIITMLQKFLITVQYFWSLSLFSRMKFGLNNFFITVKYSACFYVKFSPLLKESVVPLINNLKTTLKSVPITNEQLISFGLSCLSCPTPQREGYEFLKNPWFWITDWSSSLRTSLFFSAQQSWSATSWSIEESRVLLSLGKSWNFRHRKVKYSGML